MQEQSNPKRVRHNGLACAGVQTESAPTNNVPSHLAEQQNIAHRRSHIRHQSKAADGQLFMVSGVISVSDMLTETLCCQKCATLIADRRGSPGTCLSPNLRANFTSQTRQLSQSHASITLSRTESRAMMFRSLDCTG